MHMKNIRQIYDDCKVKKLHQSEFFASVINSLIYCNFVTFLKKQIKNYK